jgi:hypothetical protein
MKDKDIQVLLIKDSSSCSLKIIELLNEQEGLVVSTDPTNTQEHESRDIVAIGSASSGMSSLSEMSDHQHLKVIHSFDEPIAFIIHNYFQDNDIARNIIKVTNEKGSYRKFAKKSRWQRD